LRKPVNKAFTNCVRVREDGQKVLLAVKDMGGESTEARRAVLDGLVGRGYNSNTCWMWLTPKGEIRFNCHLWPI
jgi:hypothetical protein